MELDRSVAMTPELDAELAERRAAKAGAVRLAKIRAHAIRGDRFELPSRRSSTDTGWVDLAHVTAKIADVPNAPFRRVASRALDVLRTRATALVELALELDVYQLHIPQYSYTERLIVSADAELADELRTIRDAAGALFDAVAELENRVELEVLRADRDAELGWLVRRQARRDAARRLTAELGTYLEALAGLAELDSVELTAEQILDSRRAAAAEVAELQPGT